MLYGPRCDLRVKWVRSLSKGPVKISRFQGRETKHRESVHGCRLLGAPPKQVAPAAKALTPIPLTKESPIKPDAKHGLGSDGARARGLDHRTFRAAFGRPLRSRAPTKHFLNGASSHSCFWRGRTQPLLLVISSNHTFHSGSQLSQIAN